MTHYTRHIAGEIVALVQRCVVCGYPITDYRRTMVQEGTGPLKGFAEGPVYVSGGNPSMTMTAEPGPDDTFGDCSPLKIAR